MLKNKKQNKTKDSHQLCHYCHKDYSEEHIKEHTTVHLRLYVHLTKRHWIWQT